MKKLFIILLLFIYQTSFCWGFYAHRKINYYAVFLLPPEMMVLYKPNIGFLENMPLIRIKEDMLSRKKVPVIILILIITEHIPMILYPANGMMRPQNIPKTP